MLSLPSLVWSWNLYEEPTPQSVLPSAWVVEKAMKFRHFVGLSCDGFEGQLLALFTAIEARNSEQASASCSNSGFKGNRELRNLVCSINYDVYSGSASRGIVKARAANAFL